MLAAAYNQFIILITNLLGEGDLGQMAEFWITGLAICATLSLAVLPFYVIYRVGRSLW